MEKHKTCSFFGHRVIRVTEELKQKLINVIKDLIENKKVYDEKYKPKLRKYSKSDFDCYQPKSGTKIAYMYAKQKKKNILNIF